MMRTRDLRGIYPRTLSSPEPHIHDVVILGGGIAGLWTLRRLLAAGFSVRLIERHALGSLQTMASQGIIHGGIKYALTGEASAASRAIAGMPERWRDCLAGSGEIDLASVKVLSPRQYLWTTTGIGSRLAGVAASRAIRTSVESVDRDALPEAFRGAPKGVSVYSVDEPVLDPRSLVEALARPVGGTIDIGAYRLRRTGTEVQIELERGPAVRARAAVLVAGAGNGGLLGELGLTTPRQQTRPLHMLMARSRVGEADLPAVFGHCVGLSDKPRITITTQAGADGRNTWYVGGQVAERGVGLSPADLIAAARGELAACLPWLDTARLEWSTFRIDRAEAASDSGARPDGPMVFASGNIVTAWPTKLALAPLTADRIASLLPPQGHGGTSVAPGTASEELRICPLPWDRPEATWT